MQYALLALACVLLLASSVPGETAVPVGQKGVYSVTSFGATGNGTTDDTAAFQKALDEAGKTGGIVFVPAGEYMIKGHLNVPMHVTLEGTLRAPGTLASFKGSKLLAVEGRGSEQGKPFIFLNSAATVKGVVVFYPEQDKKEPVPYPWCIAGAEYDCAVIDVMLANPWNGVDFGSRGNGRHLIRGLYGHPLHTGIFVDHCFDVGRIEDVHLWPFWDIPLMKDFTIKNGTGLKFGRTDWEFVSGVFTIFFKTGFHFLAVGKSGPGNVVITSSGADLGPCAVLVEKCQPHSGLQFANCQFMAGIDVRESNKGPIKFTNCGFWGLPKETINHAKVLGNGHVTFNACHFTTWDAEKKGEPCIYSNGRALTVSSCDFVDSDKNQIVLGEKQQAAIIMGNLMRGGIKVTNKSKGKVEMGLNAE